jgi:hypothetical protein
VAICRYCGKKAGWLKEVHDECLRDAQQARLLVEQEHEQERIEKAREQVQLIQAQEAREERLNRRAREEEEQLNRQRELREYQEWRLQHGTLVDKFLEITERKVSLLDDYGDENWDALPRELENLFLKIAKADNDDITLIKVPLFKGLQRDAATGWLLAHFRPPHDVTTYALLLGKYLHLRRHLESEFRSYHESRKQQTTASEFKDLSGVEFEAYLAKVLKEQGFEDIRGTATTGDQGADLIAKRGGQTIVIQAKRYRGSVGNRAVQEVVGAINFYGADEGWVITSGTFTTSAKALAQKNNVKLIDGHALRNRKLT